MATYPPISPALNISGPTYAQAVHDAFADVWDTFGTLNITRAQIATTKIPLNSFAVSGYATVGDLGSGAVYVRGTSTGPMAIQDAAGTWWELSVGDELSIAHVGATEGPDCGPYIQTAIDLLDARGGGVVLIPKGRWTKKKTSGRLTLKNNITLRGYGPQSVIYHEDLAATSRSDLTTFSGLDYVAISDLTIEGGLGTDLSETNQSHAITGDTSGRVVLERVTLKNIRYFAVAIGSCNSVTVRDCVLEDVLRDGLHITTCTDVKVTNNTFRRVADDAVGIHTFDTAAHAAESAIDISHNYFEACQSVKALGAKTTTICDNKFAFPLRGAIVVDGAASSAEGNTATISIKISRNIILDAMGDRGVPAVIYVNTRTRSKGALTLQPGVNTSVFDYNWLKDFDASGGVNPGNFAIDISDNDIGWTRPRGVAYSTYGLGEFLDRAPSAAYYDPIMTDAVYGVTGIYVNGHLGSARIKGNTLFGGHKDYRPVHLTGGATADLIGLSGLEIAENTVFDWPSVCAISVFTSGSLSRRVSIVRNDFNLDPFVRHPDHASDGTWTSATSCMAVSVGGVGVAGILDGNHFRNMARVTDITPAQMVFGKNYVWFRPTGGTNPFDDNSVNKGVRNIASSCGYVCAVEYSDPSASNYGGIYNGATPVTVAAAMPTSGFYVTGHWVENGAKTVSSGKVLLGWSRLTTGSAHVAGTDWSPVYGTTS